MIMSKSKDWLARNQDNVSEWSNMSTHELLLLWDSIIKIQLIVLVINISLIVACFHINISLIVACFHINISLIVACFHHDIDDKLLIWH